MDVDGRTRKGRPKRRWTDSVSVDKGRGECQGRRCENGLNGGNLSETSTHIEVGKDAVEEEESYENPNEMQQSAPDSV